MRRWHGCGSSRCEDVPRRRPTAGDGGAAVDLRLAGAVAVVTGASRGIGLAVTRSLVAEGVRVVAGARSSSPELDALAATGAVVPVLVVLTPSEGSAELVGQAVERFDGLALLVNNVGAVRPRLDGFLAVPDEEFLWALQVNYLSAVRTTRAALPHLVRRAPSSIVTVSSVNAALP